jgi:hypothetical protein
MSRFRSPATASTLLALALVGCGIAETKLPPDPTVEYLPCSGMDLKAADRVDPLTVLARLAPDVGETLWGGTWTIGEEWHIGLTDVGAIDWQLVCPEISDPGLVVHEAPFPLGDLETWSGTIEGRITASGDPGSMSRQIAVQGGQYVIEIRADNVEDASSLTEGIPLDAWVYGGQVASGSG